MGRHRKLDGIDASWLAIDAQGQVAVFTTGGEGPIPETALASVETGEELIQLLPEVSGHELFTSVPRQADFVYFAKRGLFAYDWSDVHRVASKAMGAYELQALPTSPRHISQLPASVQVLAGATQLAGVAFGPKLVKVST